MSFKDSAVSKGAPREEKVRRKTVGSQNLVTCKGVLILLLD